VAIEKPKPPRLRPTTEEGGNNGGPTPGGRSTKMSSDDIPAAPSPKNYRPDQITLYGVKLNVDADPAALPFDGKVLRLFVTPNTSNIPINPKKVAIAVIYGYAFEGHCYRLDRPRLLVFEPSTEGAAEGCGFDASYMMWRIASKTLLLEIATNVGTAEDLIVDANLPGNRPPNTYGNKMQLAHRGGRLNRVGES
jgi:hypothetical protein